MGVDAEMFFDLPYLPEEAQINRWSYHLADAVGASNFFTNSDGRYGSPHLALSLIDIYEQDGPDIVPPEGHSFIKVHLFGRYYGPDYERGAVWTYIAVSEWIEHNINGATVYYGGNSSGICAKPFDVSERESLIAYWASHGHKPYTSVFDNGRREFPAPNNCGLCEYPMIRHGWGKNYASYFCPGCTRYLESRDGGETWRQRKD